MVNYRLISLALTSDIVKQIYPKVSEITFGYVL